MILPAFLRGGEGRGLFVLAAATFITRALLIYRSGTPEPDATAMVAGMALAMSGDVSMGDALIYGRHVNPGMHALAAHVFPLLQIAPQHLLLVLNWLTAICASLMVFPLYVLIRPHVSHNVAIAASAVWVATPLVWESGTYYHPLVPAALLLMAALVCARRIGTGVPGITWASLTVALGAAAFVLRVEVAVVWPAFLVWTLTSQRRARDTAILLIVTACAVCAYLLALHAITGATSTRTMDVVGFLEVITASYTHGFNLRGLPRSIIWMVLGLGIATLAAVAAGITRRPAAHRRLLWVALGWTLPSILFWLPQPTPILRHYLMASIGVAVLLAVCVLARLHGKRLILATVSMMLLNVLVPEVAYRAYNAGTRATKTPHGAFFYYHGLAAARIEHHNTVADRILHCAPVGKPARSCALVQWEQLTHVAYAAAVSGERVVPSPAKSIFPGLREVRFRVGEGDVQLLHYVYFEDDGLRELTAQVMFEARAAGYCLFVPYLVCERTPQLTDLRPAIDCY